MNLVSSKKIVLPIFLDHQKLHQNYNFSHYTIVQMMPKSVVFEIGFIQNQNFQSALRG